MSWADHYRRRDALNAVLDRAGQEPDGPLPFDETCAEVFGGRTELLLALHYKWLLALTGRLGVALSDAGPGADPVDAVAAAWRAGAADHVVLRRLIDRFADEADPAVAAALAGERRLLAVAAGLDLTAAAAPQVAGVV
ncbi:MAG TPA: hypothetical protein VFV67_25120 [Actinophytocola sp.]|uniref:hypothetical protein n=1 Tax=Actinophytocola sp. TaxID=1872138 RepID=UPI002DB59ECC|nr:hypothetical protein [Actinophytocola sp.]HEU5473941.1 hypothetical protein [Actinophytocola sp.]